MSRDRIFETADGWYCVVNGMVHGTWANRALAVAGMKVEQARARERDRKREREYAKASAEKCQPWGDESEYS
jgi:hypothetical protein